MPAGPLPQTDAPQVLTDARLVLPDDIVAGSITIADGHIREVQSGCSRLPAAVGLDGDFLLPGRAACALRATTTRRAPTSRRRRTSGRC